MNETVYKNLEEHRKAFADLEQNSGVLVEVAERITRAFKQGHRLYLCGNGGSAADCQHIAGEFVGRFRKERAPLPAVALSTDTSVLTCIGNDYSYDDVFARQVQAWAGPGDVLWAFSTSGTSGNILRAADAARAKHASVIAFTGKSGSALEQKSDLCFCSQSLYTSTAQEIHIVAYHIVCDLVELQFAES